MKHTEFGQMPCQIARSLGKVRECWSILILRDAIYVLTRFDEFDKSLNIAPKMLTRRLAGLLEGGLVVVLIDEGNALKASRRRRDLHG